MSFSPALLSAALEPFRLHWFPTLASTNDHAAAMRKAGRLYAPAIILTARQQRGRGRGVNQWWSSPDVLTCTFVFAIEEHLQPHQLPLIAGLAVRQAMENLTGGAQIQLKWPNDLLYQDRKLCGLLCERIDKCDLVGLGLNVNPMPADFPASLRHKVASLREITGHVLDMNQVLIETARQMRQTLQRRHSQTFATFIKEYDHHHALLGRTLAVDVGDSAPLIGCCEGIDSQGRLRLRSGSTLHSLYSGQVLQW